jgi:Ca-activated chloride channel homolog
MRKGNIMQTNMKIDHQLLAVEDEQTVSGMLEITAPDAPTTGRRPIHVVLVVDRSGSMSGAKLDAAKDAARFLAARLGVDDRLGIVTFDDSVDLVLPLGPVDTAQAASAIDSIHCDGSTNLSGGWLKGIEEIARGADVDATRRVLLLTDGQANVGIVDDDQLRALAAGTKAQTATTTIGFGAGFDEDLLQAIADESGGASYYCAGPEEAPGVFTEEFDGLATIVAQNLSVEIIASDDVKLLGVLNDYPVVDVANGLQVQIGDIYGGERRRVVFKLFVPRIAELGVKRVAELVLRYVETGAQIAQHQLTVPVTVNLVSADEAAAAEADHEVEEQIIILEAARATKEARDLADNGDFDGALGMIQSHVHGLRIAASPVAAAYASVLEDYVDGLNSSTYSPAQRKRMTNDAYRTHRGKPARRPKADES